MPPKLSLGEFGQYIKKKHSEFADFDDEDVAQVYLEHHPDLKEHVEITPEPTLKQHIKEGVAGAADLAREAAVKVPEAIKAAPETIGTGIEGITEKMAAVPGKVLETAEEITPEAALEAVELYGERAEEVKDAWAGMMERFAPVEPMLGKEYEKPGIPRLAARAALETYIPVTPGETAMFIAFGKAFGLLQRHVAAPALQSFLQVLQKRAPRTFEFLTKVRETPDRRVLAYKIKKILGMNPNMPLKPYDIDAAWREGRIPDELAAKWGHKDAFQAALAKRVKTSPEMQAEFAEMARIREQARAEVAKPAEAPVAQKPTERPPGVPRAAPRPTEAAPRPAEAPPGAPGAPPGVPGPAAGIPPEAPTKPTPAPPAAAEPPIMQLSVSVKKEAVTERQIREMAATDEVAANIMSLVEVDGVPIEEAIEIKATKEWAENNAGWLGFAVKEIKVSEDMGMEMQFWEAEVRKILKRHEVKLEIYDETVKDMSIEERLDFATNFYSQYRDRGLVMLTELGITPPKVAPEVAPVPPEVAKPPEEVPKPPVEEKPLTEAPPGVIVSEEPPHVRTEGLPTAEGARPEGPPAEPRPERPGIPGRPGIPPLEGAPPEAVPPPEGVGKAEPIPPRGREEYPGRRGAVRERPPEEGGIQPPTGPRERVGGREGVVGPPARRGGRAAGSGNYRISDTDAIGVGSTTQKFKDNIAAIKLLKELEAAGRKATPQEQALLVKYVGWGSMSQEVFRGYGDTKKYDLLQKLLTDEEFEAAQASTPNAHFTSPDVIKAIYSVLGRLGFKGGRVLEPSVGVGHFFGLMPPEMLGNSSLMGVELDSLTGRIARQLYQDAEIRISDFGNVRLPNNFFDVKIGNVPFGDYKVHDPAYNRLNFLIHDYFIAKSLDKGRPGSILIQITSRGTMDKASPRHREWLSDQADLIGAIRLPNTAFKKTAGTDVTADILILQKRAPGVPPKDTSWMNTVEQEIEGYTYNINQYFLDHPEMILGKSVMTGTMYAPHTYTVKPDGRDLAVALQQAIETLPKDIYTPASIDLEARPTAPALAPDEVKQGGFVIEGGRVLQKVGPVMTPVQGADVKRIGALIELRNTVQNLLKNQRTEGVAEDQIKDDQKALSKLYDKFVKRFGGINERSNRAAYHEDPDYLLLQNLEKWDQKTGKVTKGDIFTVRVADVARKITSVDTGKEALNVSLSELGKVDFSRMIELTRKTADNLKQELRGLIYNDPTKGWITSDEYLSGDVKQKLTEAISVAETHPEFKDNIEALQAVQPPEKSVGDVYIRLGSFWVPPVYVEQFLETITEVSRAAKVKFLPNPGIWVLEKNRGKKWNLENSVANTTTWGTEPVDAIALVDLSLNGRVPTVRKAIPNPEGVGYTMVVDRQATEAAREKQRLIQEEFSRWTWDIVDEDSRARVDDLLKIYNDTMNNFVKPKFDGSHLTLPGLNPAIKLRDHQKDAVWRGIQSKNTLYSHDMGTGKSYILVCVGMEKRRLGLRKKPMHVVPNHLVSDRAKDFLKLYPQAKILVPTEKDFQRANRRNLMAKIATGDWDAIIMAQSHMAKLPMSREAIMEFLRRQVLELEDAIRITSQEEGAKAKTVKELEKAKRRLETRLKAYMKEETKDVTVTFEELGVDELIVDEAQDYKALFFPTRRQRIAGISTRGSSRAVDMFMKAQYVQKLNAGGGLIFATGTPLTNTIGEMYNLQRFLDMATLVKDGTSGFDTWASNFGDMVTQLEVKPTGEGYQVKSAFARFINFIDLMKRYTQFTDIKTTEEIGLWRPPIKTGKMIEVKSPPNDELKEYIQSLVKRAENLPKDKRVDNMLKITNDGRDAALDMRLVDPAAKDFPDSKVNKCVKNLFDTWKETKDKKLTQIVFCDRGVSKKGKFNVYDDIRNKLMEKGIPKKEIAFIQEYKKDELDTLYNKVTAGQVRILIGTRISMGIGMNVQKLAIAGHNLDTPWRPDELEQGNTRVHRWGNSNVDGIYLYQYLTTKSFDVYMWQLLARKIQFIEPVLKGKMDVNVVEDVRGRELSYEEIKAIASDNPLIMEKVHTDIEAGRLQMLETAYRNTKSLGQKSLMEIPKVIERTKAVLLKLDSDLALLQKKPEKFRMTVEGKVYEERKAAGEAVIKKAEEFSKSGRPQDIKIGQYNDFPLRLDSSGRAEGSTIYAQGKAGKYSGNISADPIGTLASLDYSLSIAAIEKRIATSKEAIAVQEKKLAAIKKEIDKPFEHEQELKTLLKKQADLNKQLKTDAEEIAPEIEEEQLSPEEAKEIKGEPAEAEREALEERPEGISTASPEKYPSRRRVERMREPQQLSAKNWDVELEPEPPVAKPREPIETVSRLEIIEYIEDTFNVAIRGKTTWRMAKEGGHYEDWSELIRLKRWGELEVAMHEAAHRIDAELTKKLGEWKKKIIPKSGYKAANTELKNLDYSQAQRRPAEGFAEYIRHRITTGEAADKAPTFHEHFEKFLKTEPELNEKLTTLKRMYGTWRQQGAEQRILSQIDFKGEIARKKTIGDRLEDALDFIKSQFDEFWILKKIEKRLGAESRKHVRPTQSPFEMATYFKSKNRGIARTFVEKAAVDEWGNVLGPSLNEILKPLKANEMRSFIAYGTARVGLNRAKRGLETGFDLDDMQYIFQKYDSEAWRKISDEITAWSDHGLGWLIRAGGLSEEAAQLIRDVNPVYLPFKRVFIDEVDVSRGTGKILRQGQPIKRFKGSARPIFNPIESLMTGMTEMISRAHKIRIARLFSELGERPGGGRYIVEVPTPIEASQFSIENIKKALNRVGLNLQDILSEGEMDDFLTLFSQGYLYKGKDNVVMLWKDGKRHFYEIHPDVYKALAGVDPVRLSGIARFMSPFSRMLRLGATQIKASFGLIRNPFRDFFTYAVFSKRKTATVWEPLEGIYKDITAEPGTPAFRFKAAGGEISSMMGYDRAAVMMIYDEMLLSKLPGGKVLSVAKHPVDTLRLLFQIPELGPRIAELEKNMEMYQKEHPDWTEEDIFVAAFNDAQDITINFTRSSRIGKQINEVTAFFNAGMQGISKVTREIKANPLGVFIKGLTWLTPLAVWQWYRNKDKQWYKNLPPAYKYNNLFFEFLGEVIRLPVPFELGVIFQGLPMAILDATYNEDPKYYEGLIENVKNQIPEITPSMFAPLIDVARNKNFLGRPIESEGMKRLPVSERKRHYTTAMADALSKAARGFGLDLSPIQMDYLLWNYTGGLIKQFRFTGIEEVADWPVIGDVVLRAPHKPSRQMDEFFREKQDLNQRKAADMLAGEDIQRNIRLDTIYRNFLAPRLKKIRRLNETKPVDKDAIKEEYIKIQEGLDKRGFK